MGERLTEKERKDIEFIFSHLDEITQTPEQKSFILGFISCISYLPKMYGSNNTKE